MMEQYYESIRVNELVNPQIMKEETEQLLHYSYQYNNIYGQAYAFLYLAIFYLYQNTLTSAQFNLSKAKTLCSCNGYQALLVTCIRYEGTICLLRGDKMKAIRIYGQAMDLAEKLQDHNTIGILFNNIAVILMEYKDMELAKEYFERAVKNFLHLDEHQANLVCGYANLVQICCSLHDLDMAHVYLDKANEIKLVNVRVESALKASAICLYAHENDVLNTIHSYQEYVKYIEQSKVKYTVFTSDLLVIAESFLYVDARVEGFAFFSKFEALFACANTEFQLPFYKYYIKFHEKYGKDCTLYYERYYQLLKQSEDQEYHNLAESLRGRIELSEMSQKQSDLEKENELLQKQAHLDEMTGAYNRRYFDKLLSKLHYNQQVQMIGCIMLDVDHFKEYNDTYGHLQGDHILKQVVDTLHIYASEGIYVGRFGGDEFYCLCANLQDEQIKAYLQHVYEDLRTQHIEHIKNTNHIVTLSAGFYNGIRENYMENCILDYADQALYMAKQRGRNTFVKYKQDAN